MTGRLAGKRTIVTGAGQGLGRATALLFAAEGAQVLVSDVNGDTAAAVRAEITAAGGAAQALPADVSRRADAERMVAAAVGHFGGLDVLAHMRPLKPKLPFVVLTSHSSINTVVEAMRAGANVSIDQISVGGSMYDLDGGGMQYDVGASWTEGATELGLQYAHNETGDVGSSFAHLTYTLGPGVLVGGQIAAGDDVTQIMLGTAVFF